MAQTQARNVLPSVAIFSDAFRSGYEQAFKQEHIGWPVTLAPREDTIVQFLKDANAILDADGWPTYETHWIAGLLAGWLRRTADFSR